MKNSNMDISVLQNYIRAIQIIVVVDLLRMQKSAETFIIINNTKSIPLEENTDFTNRYIWLNKRYFHTVL